MAWHDYVYFGLVLTMAVLAKCFLHWHDRAEERLTLKGRARPEE